MFLGITADEEIARKAGQPVGPPLPEIFPRLGDSVIGVALDVGLADGVTGQARNALLVAVRTREIFNKDVLRAAEERDGIMATATITRGLRAVLLGHHVL